MPRVDLQAMLLSRLKSWAFGRFVLKSCPLIKKAKTTATVAWERLPSTTLKITT